VPRAINHVTKLFKGTYGLSRCPGGFFPEGLSNFELRDTFGSSLRKRDVGNPLINSFKAIFWLSFDQNGAFWWSALTGLS
jgi:hypothetical protein